MADSDISVTHLEPHRWLIVLTGEHDISTVERLTDALDRVFATGTIVVLDLSEATFIDSMIIKTLLSTQRRVEQAPDEDLAIVIPDGSISARVIDLVGLRNRLPIFQNRDAALQAFESA